MLCHKADSLLLRYNILKYKLSLYVVCVQDIFVKSTLRSNSAHKASLPWSQVSFPIISPGTDVHLHYSYLAAYEIANVVTTTCTSSVPCIHRMWHGEFFWSPPELIGVVFAYTFFCVIEKVVLCRQLTKPKVVSLTRPALLKHFKGTANHAGHIWSQQALVPSISVPSLQDWSWISLRGEWRLSCTPLSEITKLRVELVSYARKKGCAQKSDNRERQSQTLFSITSNRLHEVSSH